MKMTCDHEITDIYLNEFKIRFGFTKDTELEMTDRGGLKDIDLNHIKLVTFNKNYPFEVEATYLKKLSMNYGSVPTFRTIMDMLDKDFYMISCDIAFKILTSGLANHWGDIVNFKIFFLGTSVKDMIGDDYVFCIRKQDVGYKISYAWEEDALINSFIAVVEK